MRINRGIRAIIPRKSSKLDPPIIIQAGIARVVALHPDEGDKDSSWYELGLTALAMFSEAGIQFHGKKLEMVTEVRLVG